MFERGICFLLIQICMPVSSVPIRLVSPLNNGVGRIEVYYNGTWGTVCDDGFSDLSAKVACRQLGRNQEGFQPKVISSFGYGTGQIWLDDVACTGSESSLDSCPHHSWGTHNCGHSEDVGVICDERSVTMKLTPGYKSGLLQVYHNNVWGTVCDDGFAKVEATVVCRTLGYDSGDVTDKDSSIKMWLDDVDCSMNNTDLTDCKHREWGQDNCGSSEAVGVECYSFTEGSSDARLVSSCNTPGEGRLELYYNGQWGTVCSRWIGSEVPRVVCRMLGYDGGGTIVSSTAGSGTVLLQDVYCKGTENNINDCTHSKWRNSNCSHSYDLGVRCHSETIAARLVSSTNTPGEGRLELFYKGQWGTVCSRRIGSEVPTVVCRMLGYDGGGTKISSTSGSGYVLLQDVYCKGTETSINDCTRSKWQNSSCSHSYDLGVRCHSAMDTQQGIRLVSSTQGAGRVEILHNNAWGTVCKTGFTANEARVVCRMANLPWSGAYAHSSYEPGNGVIWLSNVKCQGNETGLDQCSHSSWGTSTCSNSYDVGVICTEARLSSGGNITRGRLEIFYNNQWGTVCDSRFTNMSAKVACSMVGQPSKYAYYERGSYGQGSGPVWLSNVQCTGSETSLGECSHSSWGSTSCSHSQDVGVVCSYPPEIHLDPNTTDINVNVGNDIVFECVVDDANPAVTSITWSHNGRSSTGKTFRIRNVSKSDHGTLTCTASNGLGMTPGRVQTTINILYSPEVTLDPNVDVLKVFLGSNLTVNCDVKDANPSVTSITWSHIGRVSSGPSFYIENVTQTDEGRLTCTANNGVGTSPGRADTYIRVLGGNETKELGSNWTMIHTAAVVTGVVAFLIIVVLVVVVIHLSRKLDAASRLRNRNTELTTGTSNPLYDRELSDEASGTNKSVYEKLKFEPKKRQTDTRGSEQSYENVVLGQNNTTSPDEVIYENTTAGI